MGALGLLGATLPPEVGGAGLNYVCYGLISREIERVDSGYRSMMSVQSSLVMYPIYAMGRRRSSAATCRKLATGEWIGCFGLTEPDHGSDPGSMVTRARSVPGGYQLSGAKMWISNAPIADGATTTTRDLFKLEHHAQRDVRLCLEEGSGPWRFCVSQRGVHLVNIGRGDGVGHADDDFAAMMSRCRTPGGTEAVTPPASAPPDRPQTSDCVVSCPPGEGMKNVILRGIWRNTDLSAYNPFVPCCVLRRFEQHA